MVITFINLLLVLLSCLGWGKLLSHKISMRADAGLQMGWGFCIILFIGGWLIACGIAYPGVLAAIIIVGLAALVALQDKKEFQKATPLLLLVIICVLLQMAVSMSVPSPTDTDDHLAYFTFIEQLKATGDMESPFSLRRLASYGGQTFLQTITTLGSDWHTYGAVDAALAPVLIFALVAGELTKNRLSLTIAATIAYLLCLVFGLYIVFDDYRGNTSSHATTFAIMLVLLRTFKLGEEGADRQKLIVIAGLAAAAMSSLRNNNLSFPAILFGLILLTQYPLTHWKKILRDGLLFGLSWIFFLVPWAIALYRSSGTLMYALDPSFKQWLGLFTYNWNVERWFELNMHVGAAIIFSTITTVIAIYYNRRSRLPLLGLLAAIMNILLITAIMVQDNPSPMIRYGYPYVGAACFFAVAVTLGSRLKIPKRWHQKLSLVVVFIVGSHLIAITLPIEYGRTIFQNHGHYGNSFYRQREGTYFDRDIIYEALIEKYRVAQSSIPSKEKVFVFVSGPFGFDMARNPIHNLDILAMSSPPPGTPFYRGAEALADYLKSLGIHYIIYDTFDLAANPCVSRPTWIEFASSSEAFLKYLSPLALDMMRNLETLGQIGKVTYKSTYITAVDITTVASAN